MTKENRLSDEDNGTRGGYSHGTIGAHRALAKEEADEIAGGDYSDTLRFCYYVLGAFKYACLLAVGSRTAKDEPRRLIIDEFIGAYVRLAENIERALGLRRKWPTLFRNWPQNPGVAFGGVAGWCAVDTACEFSKRLLDAVICTRAISIGTTGAGFDLGTLAITDPRINQWLNATMEELRRVGNLPPPDDWPAWKLKEDAQSLSWKINAEAEAYQAQERMAKGTETDLTELKAVETVQGNNISDGSGFVFLTGELPEEYPEEIYGETPCELVEILLKSINGYRRYFYCRPKNKLVNERLQPNLEHDKAIVWRNGLYTTASKIKAKCPELPNIPQPTGEPDLDVTPLHQWAINVKKILVSPEQPAETGGKVEGNIEAMRDQAFICYSHKDKRWLEDLETHLKPYVRNGSITAWSDKQIAPGSKWLKEIEAALASTKVAVLLVTSNFLASDFIHENELGPLLKKAKKGKVTIIWIPVRACSYKETPLKDYQAAVDPEKPLANMKAERDKSWVKICEEIKKAIR